MEILTFIIKSAIEKIFDYFDFVIICIDDKKYQSSKFQRLLKMHHESNESVNDSFIIKYIMEFGTLELYQKTSFLCQKTAIFSRFSYLLQNRSKVPKIQNESVNQVNHNESPSKVWNDGDFEKRI